MADASKEIEKALFDAALNLPDAQLQRQWLLV